MQQEMSPIFLTEDEFYYLSEGLEPLSGEDVKKGRVGRFAVRRKEDVLKHVVRCVLETELSAEERMIAAHLFIQGENVLETARNCGLSRSRVQTLSKATKEKLTAYLKYPFLLDFNLLDPKRLCLDVMKDYGGMVC